MPSTVKITTKEDLNEFVRTHLGHRLSAMVAPICLPQNHPLWNSPSRRNDAYRAAKEGSYVMLRLFIEFLGVKGPRKCPWELVERTPDRIEEDDLVLSCFKSSKAGPLENLKRADFVGTEALIAEVHRTLCKINAHFTYDDAKPNSYDRIATLHDDLWKEAVEIVVGKLDVHFYQQLDQPIIVHYDLADTFRKQFSGLKSCVFGYHLGQPAVL